MSFYLLHILTSGGVLRKKRGHLIYENQESDSGTRQIALEDLRGVILAAPNIMLSDALICSILDKGAFILHCDSKYQPNGLTMPLQRLVKVETAKAQVTLSGAMKSKIWKRLLEMKAHNQMALIRRIEGRYSYLEEKSKEKNINESAIARYYWKEYFQSLGLNKVTRRNSPDHPINYMLNYAYAVLGAICHRSLVAHGLSPIFGVHHKEYFHNAPFVYDLIEPWRPFIDFHLHNHLRNNSIEDVKSWIVKARDCWEQGIIIGNNNTQKLVDAMDHFVQTIANGITNKNVEGLWLPKMIGVN